MKVHKVKKTRTRKNIPNSMSFRPTVSGGHTPMVVPVDPTKIYSSATREDLARAVSGNRGSSNGARGNRQSSSAHARTPNNAHSHHSANSRKVVLTGPVLNKHYSERLFESLYVDGLVRKQRKIESMQAREAEKADDELVGCTFTPNIGRKGIIYQTIKNQGKKSKSIL